MMAPVNKSDLMESGVSVDRPFVNKEIYEVLSCANTYLGAGTTSAACANAPWHEAADQANQVLSGILKRNFAVQLTDSAATLMGYSSNRGERIDESMLRTIDEVTEYLGKVVALFPTFSWNSGAAQICVEMQAITAECRAAEMKAEPSRRQPGP